MYCTHHLPFLWCPSFIPISCIVNCVVDFFFWLDYRYTSLTSTLSFCKRYCGVSGKNENVIRNIKGNTIIMHGNNEYSTYAPAVNDIKVPIFVLTSSSAPSVPRILKQIQQGSNNLLQRDYATIPILCYFANEQWYTYEKTAPR